MVLESIIKPIVAEAHPKRLFFVGMMYAVVAMLLGVWIFPTYASLISVFFLAILAGPLYYRTIRLEEEKDVIGKSERGLLVEHAKAIKFFTYLFLGTMVVFAGVYLILPSEYAHDAYAIQLRTINDFNTRANELTGAVVAPVSILTVILLNNIKVLFLSFFVSFITGGGILLILFWNSSIMGTAFGSYVEENIAQQPIQGISFLGYLGHGIMGFFRYSIHGIPEIVAYIIAGFAGGLLSYAIATGAYKTRAFDVVLKDVLDLLFISFGVLVVALLIEVFVAPVFM